MDYSLLSFLVNNPKTTEKWVNKQIRETTDIKAMRILATSRKASPLMLDALWSEEFDYEIGLALAKNEKSSPVLLKSIISFLLDRIEDGDWDEEECQEMMAALRANPQTPEDAFDEAEYQKLQEKWEKEEEIELRRKEMYAEEDVDDEDYDEYAEEDEVEEKSYDELMELIDYSEEEEDNW